MPAGGELAALLARRAKVSGGDNNGAGEDTGGTENEVNSLASAAPPPVVTGLAQPQAPPSPKPTVEPVHATTPVRNEELKAIFEERNLEAGIPTPSFLVNARKNLKKPGSKEPPPRSPASGTISKSDLPNPTKHTSACSSDNAISSDGMAASLALEGASSASGGCVGDGVASSSAKRNCSARANSDIVARRNRINASRSSTSSVSSHVSNSSEHGGPDVTIAVSSFSGDISESATSNSKNSIVRANSDSGYNQETIAARRSRINASRTSISSTSSNVSQPSNKSNTDGPPDEGEIKKPSPAQMRRQIMVAKIRTSRSNPSSGSDSKQQQQEINDTDSAIPRTAIISPKRDEFEVLFADDDFVSPGDASMDSIVKEMHDMHESLLNGSYSTAASTATMPTNNESRIHMQTEIRGMEFRNYDAHDVGRSAIVGAIPNARQLSSRGSSEAGGNVRRQLQSSPSHPSPIRRNSLPLNQEQMQAESEETLPYELPQKLTPHRTTNPHDQLPQAYPFRHSPSQMSQMSAITTPSCFPQEYFVPVSAPQRMFGDLQQPMLMNETVSAKGSPIGMENKPGVALGAIGPSERLSAFSSRLEVENQRQREQLSAMARKLEEKDAIISQLMKRISDLESKNASSTRGPTLEYHVNTEGLATPSSISAMPHSSGARSNGSAGDPFAMSPVWEHSQQVPQWSNSGDTESAYLSMSSPQHSQQQPSIQKQPSLQQQAQQRRGRSSLSAATSSTASVTTSNSSKSGRRSTPRSKSVSDSSRQSRKGEVGSGKNKKNDDRKFVC
ncbi:hypothetical protein ACHAWU_006100 [Discostella pseudostelligera]|uniref:Uncharacterized protein n=1 Tax=Discostella pseudostelligera TaxID=259834 RepID=A0ABD3M358_9STRA